MNNDLLTAQDLAKSLNLSVETIWKYTREKRIPCIELGNKQYRYQLDNVLEALASSIVKEKTAEYRSADKPLENLTYQDYLYLPEEPGYHYEIIDGLLIKEPSPNVSHQRVSRKLQRILEDYFLESDPQGEIFNAPLDVTFHDTTVVQPDNNSEDLTTLTINGNEYKLELEPTWSLLYVIREKLGLVGTKRGCDRGECGTCTVIMDGRAVFSCMTLAVEAVGKDITTVEGIGSHNLNPIKQNFFDNNAKKCGFFVPGFIMTATE
jgi:aerobic-type carbon monoxide dehydrogenase small subunit (CoxS/CutS family)/transcriptional regulator with XRE-family HTH domain